MNTKDKILEAAYTLITQHGYEKTSMALISEAVNIKKASIYYYFKTKEEILLTLIDILSDYPQMVDIKQYFQEETFKENLIQYGYDTIDIIIADPRIYAFTIEVYNLANKIDSVKEKLDDYSNYTQKIMINILKHGVKIQVLPQNMDIELNAQILAIVLDGISTRIVYNHRYNHYPVWQKTIERMYLEISK